MSGVANVLGFNSSYGGLQKITLKPYTNSSPTVGDIWYDNDIQFRVDNTTTLPLTLSSFVGRTLSNAGGSYNFVGTLSGSNYPISGITGGNLINLTSDGTSITLQSIEPEVNTAASLGGTSLVGTKIGVNLPFLGLVAGTNITLATTSTGITISYTGTSGTNSQTDAVKIGTSAGSGNTGTYAVCIGHNAGANGTGATNISLGQDSTSSTGDGNIFINTTCSDSPTVPSCVNSICIGRFSINQYHGTTCIAIGNYTTVSQVINSISIGYCTTLSQQSRSINLTTHPAAVTMTQQNDAIAIGYSTGNNGYANSISIGLSTNNTTVDNSNSIAIGYNVASAGTGTYSIAIGSNTNIGTLLNCIVINAMNATIATAPSNNSACYITPIRSLTNNTFGRIVYNTSTAEVSYDTAKTFVINHPLCDDKYLVHACIESPESSVMYRGCGIITNNNNVIVTLPAYCIAWENFDINITPINSPNPNIYASEVCDCRFTVYGDNGEFNWIVYATRHHIMVEPNKHEHELHRDGPYTYLKKNIK
jgi:hypothetical protein